MSVDQELEPVRAPTRRKKDWGFIFDAITMIAVVIGVTVGVAELRQLRAAQESQAMMLLYQTLQSPEQVRGRDLIQQLPDTLSVAGWENVLAGPDGQLVRQVLLTFEGMGAMVYRGDIPIEWVDELFHFSIVDTWRKVEPATIARRKRLNYPGILEWVQWLAERMNERAQREGNAPAYELYRNWKPPR